MRLLQLSVADDGYLIDELIVIIRPMGIACEARVGGDRELEGARAFLWRF
jgi:hypothetical protein